MRASDADRDRVAGVLRDHYGDGRLSDDELAARVDRAMTAETTHELESLTSDLPAAAAAPARPSDDCSLPASFRVHLYVYLAVNLGLIAIWAASGGGYFWPIWPIIGWGIGLGGHYAPVRAGLGSRRRRQEIVEPPQRRAIARAAAPDGTVTILFSDICDSTALNERLGDVGWMEILRAHHAIVREQVAAHGGFEVKVQGDGFMIAFPSARRAVECALGIRGAMRARLGDVRLRMGLHTGEAIREEDDFYGKNVVMAARVAQVAGPDEILASAVVRQLLESAGDVRFEGGREVELKGLGAQLVHPVA